MTKIKSIVAKFEKTKLAAQLFRIVRLVVVGVVAAAVTGNPVTVVGIVTAAEVAFRQVFGDTPQAVVTAAVEAVVADVPTPPVA